jgi:hypothetical protein
MSSQELFSLLAAVVLVTGCAENTGPDDSPAGAQPASFASAESESFSGTFPFVTPLFVDCAGDVVPFEGEATFTSTSTFSENGVRVDYRMGMHGQGTGVPSGDVYQVNDVEGSNLFVSAETEHMTTTSEVVFNVISTSRRPNLYFYVLFHMTVTNGVLTAAVDQVRFVCR